MRTRNSQKLTLHLTKGQVYRRDQLASYSNAVDRDLLALLKEGVLEKVAPGLYYKPKKSRYGTLPPKDRLLVKAFLKDDNFLLFSQNEYNNLGLGLTQLYNQMVVYNNKRHGVFTLGDKTFDFRRPTRGFPRKLTPEFLLVDLLNNLDKLAEDSEKIKANIKKQLTPNKLEKAKKLAKKYGKLATQKFLVGLS